MDWSSIIPSLITAAVALAAGPGFSYCMTRSAAKREAETVKASVVAEISALLDLIHSRKYGDGFKAGMAGQIKTLTVDVPDSYFQVYRANLQKLGLLAPTVAEHIVYFYALLEAVKQDVKPGGALNDPAVDQQLKQEAFAEDAKLLRQAIEIGETLRGK